MLGAEDIQLHEALFYCVFLPSFISGAIPSAMEFSTQTPRLTLKNVHLGTARILMGCFKYAFSISLGHYLLIVNNASFTSLLAKSTFALWLQVVFAGVWLSPKFSGVRDIAIVVARLVGIKVPGNFECPLTACDITSFWRQWHMSLGNWLRATIYSRLFAKLRDRIRRSFS